MFNNRFTLISTDTPCKLVVGDIVTITSDGLAYMDGNPVARIAKQGEKQLPQYARKSTAAWFNRDKVAAVYAKITVREDSLLGAEAYLVPVRKARTPEDNMKHYKLGGLASQNPQKTNLMKMLTEGEKGIPLVLTFQTFGGNTVIRANMEDNLASGASCGEVVDADDELISFITEHGSVKAYANELQGKRITSITVEIKEDTAVKFEPLIDNAISRCIAQTPDLEAKVNYMMRCRFSDALIKAVLSDMSEDKGQIPNPQQKYYQPKGNNLADLVSYMLFGKMVRLVGEKGSGKNTLAETACWLLNRPLCRVQGSSELDKMDLLGSRTLNNGSTGFELSNALETLRDGGTVVIDEANTVRPEVLTVLHSLTDGARAVDVPGYGRVTMDKKSCILYTMNEDYIGTGEMNAATIDRGPTMIIEQEVNMAALLKEAVPNAKKEDIKSCCKVSDEIHRIIDQGNSEFGTDAIAIRGYIDALQAAMFVPLKRALIQNVANKAQSELERRAITEVIESMIG